MANWSNPTLTSLYTDFVTEVKNRDVDLALGLDPATTSPTNVPANAIRWNSANSRWEKYTSGSWGTLTATYALTSLSLTGSITFEGATDDAFETTLTVADPTADRTITLPNVSGTVVTTGDTGSITSTMIADGAVVNADVNASAAIAGTKISPDFGSQNVTTTGTSTAAGFIPSSATVPSNGLYLPAANQLGFSTASTSRLVVDASGNVNIDSGTFYVDAVNNKVGVGTTLPQNPLVVSNSGANGFEISPATNSGTTSYLLSYNRSTSAYTDMRFDASAFRFEVSGGGERMRLDASGNLGLGVVPSAQFNTVKALQIGALGGCIITGNTTAGGTSTFGQNWYVDSVDATFRYAAASSQKATRYSQYDGQHQWFTAGNGTAGNPITFTQAMTLDASGRLLVGATSDSGGALLQVNGDRIRVATANTPASATAAGTAGEVCWDASYIYVCTATNTWKRAAIATW